MMARCSSVMKALIFLTFSLHLSSAVKHSLQYFFTGVTPGINFPEYTSVGQVDGQQFVYYDSNIRKTIPRTQWIQNNVGEDYWNRETQIDQGNQEIYKVGVGTLMQRFNQTTGVHTVQYMYGCEIDDDGTIRGHRQYGYDGEDFLIYDLKTGSWTAAKSQAVISKQKWESNTGDMAYRKTYLEKVCIEWLQKYVSYGRETLERKDRPEASLFQEEASPEVVCHATGFFPKTLMISWQKDRQNVLTDVDLSETLPNQDGSFQKRSILKVSAEELQKHTYTCVIEHSSLEKDLVLPVSERRILRGGGSDGGSGGGPIGIIVGIIVALVVLVAVVAGIVVWKKKNSGFKSVPSRASSDGDSNESESVRVRVPAE